MTSFDDREKAFEAKYQFDQDLAFKARMRRDRLFGLWAAQQMGLEAEAAQTYAKQLAEAELVCPGQDIGETVMRDLAHRGIKVSVEEIQQRLEACLVQARAEIDARPLV